MSDLSEKAEGQNLNEPVEKSIAPVKQSEAPLKKAILRILSNYTLSPHANESAVKNMKKTLEVKE